MNKHLIVIGMALVIVSGFMSGCIEQQTKKEIKDIEETDDEINNELYEELEKIENFLILYQDVIDMIMSNLQQVADGIDDNEWDDAKYYCNNVLSNIYIYINETRDFNFIGKLDDARDEFVDGLQKYHSAFSYFKKAVEWDEAGFGGAAQDDWDIGWNYGLEAREHMIVCMYIINDYLDEIS